MQGFFCNKIGAVTAYALSDIRRGNKFLVTEFPKNLTSQVSKKVDDLFLFCFFAFSLYFRLLPTFYSTFCSIQLSVFRFSVASPLLIYRYKRNFSHTSKMVPIRK